MPLLISVASAQTLVKAVGTVKSVSGNSVVLTTDSGSEQTVTFADSARIVRLVPGQTDLKTAPTIAISDIQVGDRVFARGQAGEGNAVVAVYASVMKQSDLAAKQQQEREWRKGIGGIVKQVDSAANTITINNAMFAAGKPIVIHISPNTNFLRYAPDSANFDKARPGTLNQIKPGDQLNARGAKNADGTEFTVQTVVSGSFKYIEGTMVSANAADNSITVTDLATKKPVTIKVSADSQLRKLSPMAAMRIAMWLKGGTPGAAGVGGAPGQGQGQEQGGKWNGGGQGNWRGTGNAAGGPGAVGSSAGGPGSGGPGMVAGQGGGSGAQGGPGGNWRGGGGGPPDFQQIISQIISRTPAVSVSDLNQGEAVMLVATEGSATLGPTAITLLAGVEPILTAAPAGTSASTILSPWNLSAPAGAGGD